MTPKIPIEPVRVLASATILSEVAAIQYPPEAAMPPIDATTGLPLACTSLTA